MNTSMDFRHLVNSDLTYRFISPSRRSPEGDTMFFNETTFDQHKHYVSTHIGAYNKINAPNKAQIGRIRYSKDRQIIAIEIIKDHLFGSAIFKTIEIVLFKATLPKELSHKIGSSGKGTHHLMKTKVTINVERGIYYDF